FDNIALDENIFDGERFKLAFLPCFALPPGACNVSHPPNPATLPPLPPSDIVLTEENLETPYNVTYSLGGGFVLPANWSISADALYSRGYPGLVEVRENLPSDPNDPNSPRPNPTIGAIRRLHSGAGSWYYSLTATARKTFAQNWFGQLSYTWAKCTDESEFFAISVSDSRAPNPIKNERGPCRQDVRHRVVANGSYELPFGFAVGSIATISTGFPYTPLRGFDANNDGSPDQDRPPGVSRNSQRAAGYFRWDLQLSKRFRVGPVDLEVIGEVFNVTNRKNYDVDAYDKICPAGTVVGSQCPANPDFGKA